MPVVIERMTHIRWARAAESGRSSLNCRPGTLVAIGRNGPRISIGAAGLGSKVSCCGGPPERKMIRHELARGRPASVAARPARRAGNPRPSAPRPPTRISSRRERSRLVMSGRRTAILPPPVWAYLKDQASFYAPLPVPPTRAAAFRGPLCLLEPRSRVLPCQPIDPRRVHPSPSALYGGNTPNRPTPFMP